ncbi:hypothetical protein HBH99_106040 [Parastagonospora nodorum]|nr:hypothetical protein HBI06_019650 [Parastagonospora nodorum]KAH4385109.1 hypothetical protein HBH97_073930 [Parastagonospora nodorum]KAH4398757.1 hypothetical protein HBH99_106040 [Parastagonospora nodorum]KAH5391291.1 hypothetical protein HBI33_017600 [Parastagonospora nodorum]KAH6470834.1 hypothetical protein HBI59_037630 [Parastagonospora nodorum]
MSATFSHSTSWWIETEDELVWTAPITLDKGFLVVLPPAQARENSTSSSAPAR